MNKFLNYFCGSDPLGLWCCGLFYNLWLFRPPNGVLVTRWGAFWISAGRELSGVILSMNQYCEIILIDLQQSLLSDSQYQRELRSKNFTGSAVNVKYPASLWESSLNYPVIIFKQAVALLSIQSFCQQIFSACLVMKAIRGISYFPLKCLLKQASQDKNSVHAPFACILLS